MRLLYLTCVCSCALAGAAAAEPVPVAPAADGATVGLWRFQEGEGDRVAGEAAAPAGTLHGAVWVPGREGFAVATHAGHVSIPDAPALRPQGALTVEVWVKLVQAGGDLVCKNQAYMIRLGGGLQAYFSIDGRWRTVNGRRALPTGRWTHLAITYDSATRTAALYVDGALDVRQQIPDLATGLLNQGTAEVRVGTNDWNPTGSHVDGKVAALRISNVARAFEPAAAPRREAAPAGNLVPNGDFELGTLGWRLSGEGDATLYWGTDAQGPASGRLSLRTLPGVSGGDALLSRPIPVQPGASYRLIARMRSDSPGRQATLAATPAGLAGGGGSGGFSQSVDLGTEWKEVSRSFTLPEDWAAPSLSVRVARPRLGEFWVDDVRLVADDAEAAPVLRDHIAVGPREMPVGHLFFAGQPARVVLDIANTDARAHRVSVRAVATDWDGKPLPPVAVGSFDVPAGGAVQAPFSLDTGPRGTFRLGFELTAEGETWRQGAEVKYAVVVPLKGRGDAEASAFGMNTHMEREPTPHLARNMEVLAQCGVKWIRGWWGWGMCEKERGQFDWTEYDRQLATVEGAGMRLMPILLRYYPQYEQEWAGKTDGIQRPPYKMEEWGAFVRKVAERYTGRVTAWELWNEPTMSGAGFTPETYADLLRATAAPLRELDPKAKIVGFAGVDVAFIRDTLALGTAPTMDVVSEHSYSQIERPEERLPPRMESVRAVLAAAGGEKPVWHTEQGVGADDDGFRTMSFSEADVAALYTRNLVTARSLGIGKYFWFSAQCSPTYGWAVFYENYIPRPRLVALNACASFLEGNEYRRSFRPDRNAYAHLFAGAEPVCVVWNLNAPARLSLPLRPGALQAFDLMGNPVAVAAEGVGSVVRLPAERPVYLRAADGRLLEEALAAARVAEEPPVTIAARPAPGGIAVTVTSQSRGEQDGIVDLLPPAGAAPAGWPAPQHFQSLAPGASRSLTFALPAAAVAPGVRVLVGDREIQEVRAAVGGR